MNYREAIQIQIAALQQIYDNCGGLRDVAAGPEKDAFNALRGGLIPLWSKLQTLDNNLPDHRAEYKLKGNYIVEQKEA